jgi:hypothetical protein
MRGRRQRSASKLLGPFHFGFVVDEPKDGDHLASGSSTLVSTVSQVPRLHLLPARLS